MYILELEIHNICGCKHALLKFPQNFLKTPLLLVHSSRESEIITLALQLICGTKYGSSSGLNEIKDKVVNGKVRLTFTLPKQKPPQTEDEHSSDSDAPCTSRQALQRAEKRRQRRVQESSLLINACRDFYLDPDLIVYSVNGGAKVECSGLEFQIRFFTCTEMIFPRVTNITHGEYCNGKWFDLLSMEFVDKGMEENHLLTEFCKLFAKRKFSHSHILCQLTTSVLNGRQFLNNSRVSHLINIFNDIRWLFEHMTCAEYTIWFLLPSHFGNMIDISKITTENINFDSMKTLIQLKRDNASPFPWTRAEKHVQELLLVAVQLAFGYHCQQNIVYLHSLHHLKTHQSFEFLNYSLIPASSRQKNYFQRLCHVCAKLNICCVLEYSGFLPFYPSQAFIISCNWLDATKEWQICVKNDDTSSQETDSLRADSFLQQLEATFK